MHWHSVYYTAMYICHLKTKQMPELLITEYLKAQMYKIAQNIQHYKTIQDKTDDVFQNPKLLKLNVLFIWSNISLNVQCSITATNIFHTFIFCFSKNVIFSMKLKADPYNCFSITFCQEHLIKKNSILV